MGREVRPFLLIRLKQKMPLHNAQKPVSLQANILFSA